jgi:hypothetical protein
MSLTNEQIDAIESYSGSSSMIQHLLRTTNTSIENMKSNRIIETIKVLDTAIKDTCSKPFVVYNGLTINIFENTKNNEVYKPEYISTSSDIKVAQEHIEDEPTSFMYHITIQPGVQFIDFCKYEDIPHDEKEILIQRGTHIRLDKKDGNTLYCTVSKNTYQGGVATKNKTFTYNGNKYSIIKTQDGHCVRKNGIYMCTKEVKVLLKEIKNK